MNSAMRCEVCGMDMECRISTGDDDDDVCCRWVVMR